MKYWLYRLREQEFVGLSHLDRILIDYLPEPVADNDSVVVFVAGTLNIVGAYTKKGDSLILKKATKDPVDLRKFYDKLSIIKAIGERTYKVFAKKVKEITKADYEVLTAF